MEIVVHSKKSVSTKASKNCTFAIGIPNLAVQCKEWSNWIFGVGQKIRLPVLLELRLRNLAETRLISNLHNTKRLTTTQHAEALSSVRRQYQKGTSPERTRQWLLPSFIVLQKRYNEGSNEDLKKASDIRSDPMKLYTAEQMHTYCL